MEFIYVDVKSGFRTTPTYLNMSSPFGISAASISLPARAPSAHEPSSYVHMKRASNGGANHLLPTDAFTNLDLGDSATPWDAIQDRLLPVFSGFAWKTSIEQVNLCVVKWIYETPVETVAIIYSGQDGADKLL
jgi:hypothetical protein